MNIKCHDGRTAMAVPAGRGQGHCMSILVWISPLKMIVSDEIYGFNSIERILYHIYIYISTN